MTYAGFLLAFLVVPIVLLLAALLRGRTLKRFHWVGGGLVALIAFCYTTPWDNYAAARRLWTFDPAFVWGPPLWFGSLPLEEYLFYLAEAALVCLAVVALARVPWLAPEPDDSEAAH